MKFSEMVLPSDKKIGYFFSCISIILSIYFYYYGSLLISLSLLFFSLILTILALFNPILLRPINILWMFFGFALGKIISPIVLGILFFFVFTPISIVQSLMRRDELKLKYKKLDSSWTLRNPQGPNADSFKHQF
jgi:hypothetical protein